MISLVLLVVVALIAVATTILTIQGRQNGKLTRSRQRLLTTIAALSFLFVLAFFLRDLASRFP